jgi:hypothetical protein
LAAAHARYGVQTELWGLKVADTAVRRNFLGGNGDAMSHIAE